MSNKKIEQIFLIIITLIATVVILYPHLTSKPAPIEITAPTSTVPAPIDLTQVDRRTLDRLKTEIGRLQLQLQIMDPNLLKIRRVNKVGDDILGADNFQFVGGKRYKLAGSGVASSATSVILRSFTLPVTDQKIVMTDFGDIGFGTMEPSTNRQEFISFTGVTQNADGTATLTGLSRGLAPVAPYTASTTLQQAHAGNSIFIISNSPNFYDQQAVKDNDESITGIWDYASTSPPRYDLVPTNHNSGAAVATTSEFASLAYVNNVAVSGAPNASETVKGLTELATAIEQASSTILGGTGAGAVNQAQYSTSTPTSACDGTATIGALCSPVARNSGKLSQLWIDLTEAFTWTGVHTFSNALFNVTGTGTTTITSGTTTWNGTTPTLVVGSSTPQGGHSIVTNDSVYIGQGNLQFPDGTTQATAAIAWACTTGHASRTNGDGTGSQVIAHGLGVTPDLLRIFTSWQEGTGGTREGVFSEGLATTASDERATSMGADGSGGTFGGWTNAQSSVSIITLNGNGLATLTGLDGTNITLDWTTGVASGGNALLQWETCGN